MTAAQNNPAYTGSYGIIKVLCGEERKQALAESREKARMDLDSYLSDAKYEGRQEGKLEVAHNLLREKMPIETIARLTGLPVEDVLKIATEL